MSTVNFFRVADWEHGTMTETEGCRKSQSPKTRQSRFWTLGKTTDIIITHGRRCTPRARTAAVMCTSAAFFRRLLRYSLLQISLSLPLIILHPPRGRTPRAPIYPIVVQVLLY